MSYIYIYIHYIYIYIYSIKYMYNAVFCSVTFPYLFDL